MRHVNEQLKLFAVVIISGCIFMGHAFAEGVVKRPAIQSDRERLEYMLRRSAQVIIGHFDLESVENINNLNSDEPVNINFLIEHHIKGIDLAVESIEIPVPYELFMMRTEEGMDNHVAMMTKNVYQRNAKEYAYKNGELSKDKWLVIDAEYTKNFRSHMNEVDFYRAIKRGQDMSFKSDVKYALFLGHDFDGDYIDWAVTIVYKTFSRGSGTFADLLFEEVE